MSTQDSWATRGEIISSFQNLRSHLANYKITFLRLKEIKETVLDNPTLKADLKLLFDQDTTLSMTQVTTEYAKAKVIYDWLVVNG